MLQPAVSSIPAKDNRLACAPMVTPRAGDGRRVRSAAREAFSFG